MMKMCHLKFNLYYLFIHLLLSIILILGIDETVKEVRAIGGKCFGYKVDISKKEEVYKAAEAIKRDAGDVSK